MVKITRQSVLMAAMGVVLAVGLCAVVYSLANQVFKFDVPHTTYFVSPGGNDAQTGLNSSQPFKTIQRAIALAKPGDHVNLADGDYAQSFHTVRSGQKGAPIAITGSQKAVVRGDPQDGHVVDISNDFITLDGFTIDGQTGDGTKKADFHDKLIYVIGTKPKAGVQGLVITRMTIQNAGGECLRLRYFAHDNEVSYSTIKYCGVYDFRFNDGGKNGEGIYIGTAPEQRPDGKNPTQDADASANNHIHHNTIQTYGNECVDVKEGAHDNLIEHNTCGFQMDYESGGFDARGNNNTFRYNTVSNNRGAGIRLGGDGPADGINNNVYGNIIANNQRAAIRILRPQQGILCDNSVANNGVDGAQTINITEPCG